GEHGVAYYYTSLLVQHNRTENLYRERKSPAALGGRPGYQLGFRANRSALEDDKVLGLRPEPVGILDLEVAVETRSVTRRDISVVEALPRYDRIIATRVRHSYLPHRSLIDGGKHRCVERTSRLQRAARVREEKVGATLADDDALV